MRAVPCAAVSKRQRMRCSRCSSAAPVKSDGSIGARPIFDRGAASLPSFTYYRVNQGLLSGWLGRSVELAVSNCGSCSAHHKTGGRCIATGRFFSACDAVAPAARARCSNGKEIVSPTPPYIDPIAHAWRHCNPHAPLPSALATRAGSRSLDSSNGQIVSQSSGTAEDARQGLLSVAMEPWISPYLRE